MKLACGYFEGFECYGPMVIDGCNVLENYFFRGFKPRKMGEKKWGGKAKQMEKEFAAVCKKRNRLRKKRERMVEKRVVQMGVSLGSFQSAFFIFFYLIRNWVVNF